MQVILAVLLAFCLQVPLLQAACNSLNEPRSTTTTLSTINQQQQETTPATSEHGVANFENELSLLHGTSPNRANSSGTTTATKTSTRLGPDDEQLDLHDISKFRLEFNKYKILSQLSITANLDEMSPNIDEDTRYKLISNMRFKEAGSASSSRHKRSLTCDQVRNDKNACCLENFYVNFTHIGWDKWILYPPGYNANYCRGKCDLSHARYFHSTLLSKYSDVISLCCSPKQMAPLRLLYIDDENKVQQKSIADMVVESCDCA